MEPECEWTADQVRSEVIWTTTLSERETRELDAALRHALSTSNDILDIKLDDFPLDELATKLREIERELIDGRGFARIRGIDRSKYDQAEMEMLYWGIGTHLGTPWAQNKHGHVAV